jgi:adenosine deaminase
MPRLTRIGHATQAVRDPYLLEILVNSGVTVECSLSCNVVLGAVPAYREHPVRQLIDAGIPVALGTDDPVQICTTIGREYAIAHQLGFSVQELLTISRNAIHAAFTTPERRITLLKDLDQWEEQLTNSSQDNQ